MRAAALLLAAALAVAGCARKGDPLPPAGAAPQAGPTLTAPGVVTDPIRRGKAL